MAHAVCSSPRGCGAGARRYLVMGKVFFSTIVQRRMSTPT